MGLHGNVVGYGELYGDLFGIYVDLCAPGCFTGNFWPTTNYVKFPSPIKFPSPFPNFTP